MALDSEEAKPFGNLNVLVELSAALIDDSSV